MSSYTNIFGSTPTQTAEAPYRLFTLNGQDQNIVLNWPTDFFDTNNTTAYFMNVNCTAAGTSITLPDTTLASVGQNFIVYNSGNQQFTLQYQDGTQLIVIPNAQAYFFELIDNTTANGQWLNTPFGAAFQGVTRVAATAPARGFTVAGSPIVNNGTLVFTLANMLAALEILAVTGNQGLIVQIGDSNIAVRSVVPGDNNINIANQNGAAGNITLTLSQNLTGLISAIIGNLLLQGNTISARNEGGPIILSANGQAPVQSNSNIQLLNGKSVSFTDLTNQFTVSIANSPNANATFTLYLPIALGANNSIMQTDVNGNLSFSALTTAIANQQQMQEATSQINPVTPSNIIHSKSACKVWGSFSVAEGQITLVNNLNVTSITYSGAGVYLVTTAVSFNVGVNNGGNCGFVNACSTPSNANPQNLGIATIEQTSGNTFTIYTRNWSEGGFYDFNQVGFGIFGTLQ